MDISWHWFTAYILGRRTRPPHEIFTLGDDGRPVKVPYNPPWYKAPLLMAVRGAAWLAVCITALTVLLTLIDAWVIGG